MDPRDLFRSFFGLPSHYDPPTLDERQHHPHHEQIDPHYHHRHCHAYDHSPEFFFQVFTEPMEMNRFFDEQMESILKSFGFGPGHGFGALPPGPGFGPLQLPPGSFPFPSGPDHPAIPSKPLEPSGEDGDMDENSAGSRDFMLKDDTFGYTDRPPQGLPQQSRLEQRDTDLDDEKLDKGQIGKLFSSDSPADGQVQPFIPDTKRKGTGNSFFFSASTSQKSVRLPDGSLERSVTKRSSDGHETTTVTRSLGDKAHVVTTITRPDGTQEITENYLNTDEHEFRGLFGQHAPPANESVTANPIVEEGRNLMLKEKIQTQSLFDKFFGRSGN